PRVLNVPPAWRSRLHIVKIRSALDVSGTRVPVIGLALRHLQAFPLLITSEDSGVIAAEHSGINGLIHRCLNLLLGGPDVAQENRLALFVFAQGLAGNVAIN